MSHTAVQDIAVRHQNERQTAVIYKFMFKYKGKQHEVQVIAHSDVTRSEIEDSAGVAAETWMRNSPTLLLEMLTALPLWTR